MNTIQKIRVRVAEIEGTEDRTAVKDPEGVRYTFFNNKKDGTASKASITFQQYGVKVGSIVEINFAEEEFTGKDGTPRRARKVMSFAPVTEQVPLTPKTSPAPLHGDKREFQIQIQGWAQTAVNAKLIELEQVDEDYLQTMIVPIVIAQNLVAERMAMHPEHPELTPNAKAMNVPGHEPEISVEDIPF